MPERLEIQRVLCSLGYKKWAAYPADVQELLKKEYARGAKECMFTIWMDGKVGGQALQTYTVHYENKTQSSGYSGKLRTLMIILEGEAMDVEGDITEIEGQLVPNPAHKEPAKVVGNESWGEKEQHAAANTLTVMQAHPRKKTRGSGNADAESIVSGTSVDGIKTVMCKLGYKKWGVYPPELQELLRKEYARGAPECKFIIRLGDAHDRDSLQTYTINFKDSTQLNAFSGKSRPVKILRAGEAMGVDGEVSQMNVTLVQCQKLLPTWDESGKVVDEQVWRDTEQHVASTEWARVLQGRLEKERQKAEEARQTTVHGSSRGVSVARTTVEAALQSSTLLQSACDLHAFQTQVSQQEVSTNKFLTLSSSILSQKGAEREKIKTRMSERQRADRAQQERIERISQRAKNPPQYLLVTNSYTRSDALRLALLYIGEPFEEQKVKSRKYKGSVITGTITVHQDGFVSRSCWAMLRYIGLKFKLYPGDVAGQKVVDDIVGDLRQLTNVDLEMPIDSVYDNLEAHEDLIKSNEGRCLVGSALTIADFELASVVRLVLARKDADMSSFKRRFPNIMKVFRSIRENEAVSDYHGTISTRSTTSSLHE